MVRARLDIDMLAAAVHTSDCLTAATTNTISSWTWTPGGVKIQPMLTDQNYIEILMHCTLILATLRFTDTNANVKEVSTKYSTGSVRLEIENNKRVLVSTLKFLFSFDF